MYCVKYKKNATTTNTIFAGTKQACETFFKRRQLNPALYYLVDLDEVENIPHVKTESISLWRRLWK